MAHTKLVIPMVCGKERYQITVGMDNPLATNPAWFAHGSDFVNPMESPMGWGDSPETAIYNFFFNYYPQGTPDQIGC